MHNKVPKNEYLNKKGYAPKKNPEKIVNEGVIYDLKGRGQWEYPGEVTKIPSGNITMQGVPYPVLGVDDLGNEQMMYPGFDYTFPGNTVTEYPQLQYGGDPSIPKLNSFQNGGVNFEPYSEDLNWFGDTYKDLGISVTGNSNISFNAGNYLPKGIINKGTLEKPTYFNPYIGADLYLNKNKSLNFQVAPDYAGLTFTKQFKKGGWLNKYSKMPKKKSSKNIKSSINKLMTRNPLFERNYMLYGAKGPRLYDPTSKFQGGGAREPIYVSSPLDPRYIAYTDSLSLYNLSNRLARNAGPYPSNFSFPRNPILRQDYNIPYSSTGTYTTPFYSSPVPIGITIGTKDYRKEVEKSLKRKIKPIGYTHSDIAIPVYIKPKERVVVVDTPAPPAPVVTSAPTQPNTKYAYMPTNFGPVYYYEWDAQQKKWIPISQQAYNYNTKGGTENTQLYDSKPPGFKQGGWLDSYQDGGQPAAPMTYDEYADIYFQNLADLEAEKARVAQVRSNIIPTAQKIDAAANPQKFLVGAPATGNFCNAYTNQCYNIAGATTVAPIGNIPAGSRMPMIPGNLAQQAVLSQEGIVSIPLSEAQPGDIIKKEYYSPGLPWQGNYNPQGNPYWLPGHSMIYAGTDAQGNPMVYNSPGGRNIYESRTFKPSEWKENTRGTFTGNPTGTSRMQAYKYVGNTPALETEAQQSRQQMLGATSYMAPKTAYLSSPVTAGVITPNYQQMYDQRKKQFDQERKAIEEKRYLSKGKKKADLKALDQQEKDTLAMYIQPTPISTPPASIETNTASVTPNGSKKKYGGWLDSYQNRK